MYLADDRETTLHRIVSFDHSGVYELRLRFDDGHQQVINFDPLLQVTMTLMASRSSIAR